MDFFFKIAFVQNNSGIKTLLPTPVSEQNLASSFAGPAIQLRTVKEEFIIEISFEVLFLPQ